MSVTQGLTAALPKPQPDDPGRRLLLFGLRQMGAHGLADAATAHAFVTAFGKDFRRPLILLRAFVQEMSATSAGPIQIAPWCCGRMTCAEVAVLDVLGRVEREPRTAAILLADLLGTRAPEGVLATAHAVARAFSDLGLPLD
ncbi:MAG: DUF6628 family protein [Pseudomonadota bacterium]